MGRIWFLDTQTGKWDFVIDWRNYEKRCSYTCIEQQRYIGQALERITGWEYNRSIFNGSTSLMFNGKADYGKRGRLFDIDHKSNKSLKKRLLRDDRLNELGI